MRTDIALRSTSWLTILLAAGSLLAGGIVSADAADYAGPYGWAPPPGPRPVYAPRPHPHRYREVAVYAPEPTMVFDDPTAGPAESLAFEPAPPSSDVVARRERLLPVGVIYNVPADPFLARRRYGPVIRANY